MLVIVGGTAGQRRSEPQTLRELRGPRRLLCPVATQHPHQIAPLQPGRAPPATALPPLLLPAAATTFQARSRLIVWPAGMGSRRPCRSRCLAASWARVGTVGKDRMAGSLISCSGRRCSGHCRRSSLNRTLCAHFVAIAGKTTLLRHVLQNSDLKASASAGWPAACRVLPQLRG